MDATTRRRGRFLHLLMVLGGVSVLSLTVRALVGVPFDVHVDLGADAIGRRTLDGLRLDGVVASGHVRAGDLVANLLHAAPGVLTGLAVAVTALLLRKGVHAPYAPEAGDDDRDEWFGRAVAFAVAAGVVVAIVGSYCRVQLVSRVYDDGYVNYSVTLEPLLPGVGVWLLTKWWAATGPPLRQPS